MPGVVDDHELGAKQPVVQFPCDGERCLEVEAAIRTDAFRQANRNREATFVVAELDYMILKYAGVEAEIAFMKEIEDGVYQVADLNEMIDFHSLRNQLQKYASLKCGIADISTMLLASVNNTLDVLTLDERHFRALRTPYNKPLRLLPFDSNVVSVRRKRSATTLRRL